MNGLRKHLTHIIYQSGPENNLQLVARHKNALHQIYIFNTPRIRPVIVLQYQPKPCGTVRHPENIVPSPGKPDDFRRYFFIALSFLRIHF